MKKIYILLCLTTHIASISCMEKHYSSNEQKITIGPFYRIDNTAKQLCKNEIQPDSILEKLYNDTWNVIQLSKTSHLRELIDLSNAKVSQLKKLIDLITTVNQTKNETFHEDLMGTFSYNQWKEKESCNKLKQKETEEHFKTVLFFGYLKRYNLTIKKTNESLPSISDLLIKDTPNRLAIILGLEVPSNNTKATTYEHYYDACSTNSYYPAFHKLKCKLDYKRYADYENFTHYIYSNKPIQKNNYLNLSYTDLQKQFYDKAYVLMKRSINYDGNCIHSLIQIIEAGKTLTPAKQECDFEYDFVNFTQTSINQSLVIDSTFIIQQLMVILCRLIKQYNDQCKTKITPTLEQARAYRTNLSYFTLPDSFDSTLFDKKIYAFEELEKLNDNIRTLLWSDDKYKEECFDALYPQKK